MDNDSSHAACCDKCGSPFPKPVNALAHQEIDCREVAALRAALEAMTRKARWAGWRSKAEFEGEYAMAVKALGGDPTDG